MKHFATFLSLSLASLTLAQPVLTEQNSAPLPGQAFPVNQGSYVPPPAGGAGQTWDFSALDVQGSATVELIDPAGTIHASSYPTSDVLETSAASSQFRYFNNTTTGLELLGYSAPSQGFVLPFSPVVLQRPYPCTFGNAWSGDYGGFTAFQGFDIILSGTYEGEADGHGTVIMPWGTVENVLRTRFLLTETQLFVGQGQSTNQQETWDFHTPGSSYPLVRISERRTLQQGGGSTIDSQSLLWLAELNTNAADMGTINAGPSLFPNPAHGNVRVHLPTGARRIDVIDATGRQVRSMGISQGTSGIADIDLSGMIAGLYTVRIQSADGAPRTDRLIIE